MNANLGWRKVFKDAYSHYFRNNESLCGAHEMCTTTKYFEKPTGEACPGCEAKLKERSNG